MSRKRGSSNDPTSRFVLRIMDTDTLAAVLDSLSEREAGVITMRFGILDGQPKTLDEIARVYGVTRERVRQFESKTLSKLRHSSRSDLLTVMDGKARVGFIDALFGRHDPLGDDLVPCSHCHKHWFDPQSGVPAGGRTRKYCSDKCRQAAYRARRRALRSYLDSAANHGLTALDAISNALAGKPWLPATLPAIRSRPDNLGSQPS